MAPQITAVIPPLPAWSMSIDSTRTCPAGLNMCQTSCASKTMKIDGAVVDGLREERPLADPRPEALRQFVVTVQKGRSPPGGTPAASQDHYPFATENPQNMPVQMTISGRRPQRCTRCPPSNRSAALACWSFGFSSHRSSSRLAGPNWPVSRIPPPWFRNPDWGLGRPFPCLWAGLAAGVEFTGGGKYTSVDYWISRRRLH